MPAPNNKNQPLPPWLQPTVADGNRPGPLLKSNRIILPTLIQYGKHANSKSGFPAQFIQALQTKSQELQSSISLRAGEPPNIDAPCKISAKPVTCKPKTSSSAQGLPIVAGWIPLDQAAFGRSQSKDIPPEFGGNDPDGKTHLENAFHLETTLRAVLTDAKNGKYQVTLNNNFLEFKSLLADETTYTDYDKEYGKGVINKNEITFRINLGEGITPIIDIDTAKELRPTLDRDPGSVLVELGISPHDPRLNQAYKINYQKPGVTTFTPLFVAAHNGSPITGDADKLWVAPPIELARACKHLANSKYDATKPSQLANLLENYIELKSLFLNRELSIAEVESEYTKIFHYAKSTGIITPFELLTNKVINDEFIKAMPYEAFLLQHGPETNNPGPPSDLDGKMLHIHKGQSYLTETEDQLIDFILDAKINYLQDKFILIHPGWNIEKWAPVIEKQIALGQSDLMEPATLKNFHDYQHQLQTKPLAPRQERLKSEAPMMITRGNPYQKINEAAELRSKIEGYQRRSSGLIQPTSAPQEPAPAAEPTVFKRKC